MKPRWPDKLTRVVRDTGGKAILTRKDAANYMSELPHKQAMRSQWQAAAKFVLDGADAESITKAVELALLFEGRLDVKHANGQHGK